MSGIATESMEYRLEPGRKGPDDRIIFFRSVSGIEKGPWEPLTMADLGYGAVLFSENEERLKKYNPHWYRGGKKIYDFIRDCGRHGLKSACSRHQLSQAEFTWPVDGGQTENDD